MKTKSAKVYWWTGRKNFGDALAPHLLYRFARVVPTWAPATEASVVTVGSVLDVLRPVKDTWKGIVLGSGRLYEDRPTTLPLATILALRGPLTMPWLKGVKIGDPGLLAPELVSVARRVHNLGILPHWSDDDLPKRHLFAQFKPLVIDPAQDPLEVIQQIGSCKKIVTSSLHGAIVADAFGIPRRIEVAPRLRNGEGGMFKFRDYNAAVGVPHEIGMLQQASRQNVETLQHDLFDLYEQIGDYL